jgi:putative glutamine amidotransferase
MSLIIGMTSRPGTHIGLTTQFQYQDYVTAIDRSGASPLVMPLVEDPLRLRPVYEHLDALCLPGGADVDPARYGEELRAGCSRDGAGSIAILDACEFQLLQWALEDDLPVLAVCRGLQVLNVARGGSLWQDLNAEGATAVSHWQTQPDDQTSHSITVSAGSMLGEIIGRDVEVNSMHHQGVRDLGDGLVATATSPDGVVEAVEMPDRRFVLGVQFHPEEMIDTQPYAIKIFEALVAAAGPVHAG